MLIICDKWRSLHYYGKIRNDYTYTLIFRSGKFAWSNLYHAIYIVNEYALYFMIILLILIKTQVSKCTLIYN